MTTATEPRHAAAATTLAEGLAAASEHRAKMAKAGGINESQRARLRQRAATLAAQAAAMNTLAELSAQGHKLHGENISLLNLAADEHAKLGGRTDREAGVKLAVAIGMVAGDDTPPLKGTPGTTAASDNPNDRTPPAPPAGASGGVRAWTENLLGAMRKAQARKAGG